MRKLLLLCLLSVGTHTAFGQDQARKCPPGAPANHDLTIQQRSNAIDFTTTFSDGSSATLFTVLNAGNTVVLDFFYTT